MAACAILLALLVALLAGCGSSATVKIGGRQTGSAGTPTASATLGSTALPTAPLDQQASCARNYTLGTFVQVGGVIISPLSGGLNNPSMQVPDGTLDKPIQLPLGKETSAFPHSPEVNPQMHEGASGETFVVCDGSASAPHTLQSVRVSIASFTPYTGQLNAWQPCDGFFTKHYGYSPTGCPGDAFYDELLHATFGPGDGVGATVTAAQTGANPTPGHIVSPLPVTLSPGGTVSVDVGITVPTAPGTYTFAFSVVVDGAAPVRVSTTDPLMFAPVARWWSGKGCTQPAMLAQIPASAGQDDEFICPIQ